MDDIRRPSTDSIKRFLKRYKRNKDMIRYMCQRRDSLAARIESLRSPGISDMPRGGEHKSKEDLIAEKLDIERRIEKFKARGARFRLEITDVIDTLDNCHEAEVLERYLIDCEDFDEIAAAMGFSERHVVRLYTSAVTKIADLRREPVG